MKTEKINCNTVSFFVFTRNLIEKLFVKPKCLDCNMEMEKVPSEWSEKEKIWKCKKCKISGFDKNIWGYY